MPWQELGAGAAGAIPELTASGVDPSLAACTSLFPFGEGAAEGGHVCVSVLPPHERCRAPRRVWPGVWGQASAEEPTLPAGLKPGALLTSSN